MMKNIAYRLKHYASLIKKGAAFWGTHGSMAFFKAFYKYLHGIPISFRDRYDIWMDRNEIIDESIIKQEIGNFTYQPKISIITPTYNTDAVFLGRCLESVLCQYYSKWELCIHDDCSTNPETITCLQQWSRHDPRIKCSFGERNLGIAGASNLALDAATGEFIAFLDHDDELAPQALFEVVKLLNQFTDTDVIYSDEDKIKPDIHSKPYRYEPFFKPEWSPLLLMDYMYIGHLTVMRRSLLDKVGAMRSQYDFSQDYDLALRVTEVTDKIRHIPKILYHWRAVQGSAAAGGKDFARASNIAALEDAIRRRGYDARVIETPSCNRVQFKLNKHPLISIIIPSDNYEQVTNCLKLLINNTSYPNYEIIIVTNSQLGHKITTLFSQYNCLKICEFDKPFNFSLKCNEGAMKAQGEYILFLNDDIEIHQQAWIEPLLEMFSVENIGAVSPQLYYENDTIQYGGMVTGVRGLNGTAFHTYPKESHVYFNFILVPRETSILSGACLLMPRDLFLSIGGFDHINMPVAHSDVDLSFRLRELGYHCVYQPFSSLKHIGHLSLGKSKKKLDEMAKKWHAHMYLFKRWGDLLGNDPYFPENIRDIVHEGAEKYYKVTAFGQEEPYLSAQNILLVSHELSLTGAPIILADLATFLKAQGFFVTVMCPFPGKLSERYAAAKIPVIIDETLLDGVHTLTSEFMASFDLLIANTILMWPAIHAVHSHNKPAIWLLHESQFGVDYLKNHRLASKTFELANHTVIPSQRTKDKYKRFINGRDIKLIRFTPKPIAVSEEIINNQDRFTIVCIGSIEHRKGQDLLIKSLKKIPKAYKESIDVLIIGKTLSDAFFDKCFKLKSEDINIEFIGTVAYEQITYYYQIADVIILTSRDEVCPLVVKEAMSAGKAVIATDVGDVSEIMENMVEGIIVPPEDPKLMAEKIVYLFENRAELQRLGNKAREKYFAELTPEKYQQEILELITGLLHKS